MNVETLRCAVIGLGVGEQHARAYAQLPGCSLKWVHDHDGQRAERVIRETGQGRAAASLEQILADPDTDVVSIASYDGDHAAQVIACLQAGKHVFCEKPLCRTAEELAAIERAWRGSGRALATNLVLRAAPLYRWLRAQIARGELGEIYAVDGDYLYGRLSKITDGWRSEDPAYSVMLGGGIHLVDLMLLVVGERPRAVTAAGSSLVTRHTRFRHHDFLAATYTFPGGAIGRITANFGCVHRHHHVLRVFGTRATFLYDDRGPRWHSSRDPELSAVPVEHAALPASKGDLIPEFVAQIRAGAPVPETTEHELAVVAACIGADRAAAEGRPSNLEPA